MIGRLKDLTFERNGDSVITVTVHADFGEQFDALKDFDIDVDIKRHREKRSRDANAYAWVLIGKLAEELNLPKNSIYLHAIKEVGVYKDFRNMLPKDAETLSHAWQMLGTGWPTEQVDYSADGERVTIRCYYGSSQYNTKQMSRLIDLLVQDCHEVGIQTETPEEIEKIKSLWGQAPKGEKDG